MEYTSLMIYKFENKIQLSKFNNYLFITAIENLCITKIFNEYIFNISYVYWLSPYYYKHDSYNLIFVNFILNFCHYEYKKTLSIYSRIYLLKDLV